MAAANVPAATRRLIWNEAFQTATLLDGLMVVTVGGVTKTRWEHWYGSLPGFAQHLHTWGEAGVVKIRGLATPKVANRGVPCMFVGYSKNHPADTYRMYNPASGGIHDTRDVVWLRRMFYQTALSPSEFQVQADGVYSSEPVEVPVIDFDDVDTMEEYDTAPTQAGGITQQNDEGIEDNNNDNNNDHDNAEDDGDAAATVSEPDSATADARPTRSGRVPKPRARYEDIDWEESDLTARQLLRIVRREMDDHDDDGSSESASEASEPEEKVEEDEEEDQEAFVDSVQDEEEEVEEVVEFSLGQVDIHFFSPYEEVGLVGASLGGGFASTLELKPLNFDEAIIRGGF